MHAIIDAFDQINSKWFTNRRFIKVAEVASFLLFYVQGKGEFPRFNSACVERVVVLGYFISCPFGFGTKVSYLITTFSRTLHDAFSSCGYL